ncbi:MAG TPA: hypothetical protein VG778_09685 [Blastocatellia bacterium]|jgi:hypothetical protein|nr:hypothetical protein [Blastocatellia bacterium]
MNEQNLNEEGLTDLTVTEAQADETKGGPAVSNNLKQIGIGCHNIASTY